VNTRRVVVAVVVAALAISGLAGCTETPSFSSDGNNTGYVSGAGVYTEIKVADRKPAASFSSVLDTGAKVTSAQLLGTVHVLNFWYASCGPCRVEAPRMEAAYSHYKGSVPFYGVDVYDQAATALTFESTHKITYSSMIDTNSAAVQYAYSAYVSPDAVPTTLVIDKHGRVAARVTGEVEDSTILTSLIDRVIAEGQ
jgi:thiol-disulfide isomerase/thioredoxin